MAFSRRQVLSPKPVNLSSVAGGLQAMLKRIIGEDIELAAQLSPELRLALVDPGQMEQVIMNLVVNSRDAMPEGGRVLLSTSNEEVAPGRGWPDFVRPGSYTMKPYNLRAPRRFVSEDTWRGAPFSGALSGEP